MGKQTRRMKPDSPRRPSTKKMVKDPVCGMYLDPRLAIKHSGKEGDVFFCTDDCRQKYLKRHT
jgi:YHS domain-containing protein